MVNGQTKWSVITAVEAIKQKFAETGSPIQIPTLKRGSFTAELANDGVVVDNLGNEPFLPWAAFQEAVCIMIQNGGKAKRGDALGAKLGEPDLSTDSIEGHVARVVYGKRTGDSVFRRITPIACILIWAGVCAAIPKQLVLRGWAENSQEVKQRHPKMAIDWSTVKREHVIEACHLFDAGRRLPAHPARNTFLLFRANRYPAKFIRGLAYELATSQKLNPSVDYSGGKQTADFLRQLGFMVEYNRRNIPANREQELTAASQRWSGKYPDAIKKSNLTPSQQRNALRKWLHCHFGMVQTEAQFDWLVVPEPESMDADLLEIFHALTDYRGFTNFISPKRSLQCDYYIPSRNLIIEYDERQHFTIPMGISLSLYPGSLRLNFDIQAWCKACLQYKLKITTLSLEMSKEHFTIVCEIYYRYEMDITSFALNTEIMTGNQKIRLKRSRNCCRNIKVIPKGALLCDPNQILAEG